MQSEICWLCDKELTTTREHIIPESMGGKKTVRGFICRDCNSTTGHAWDVDVTNFESWKFQLNPNLHINPRQGKSIRGVMADTGLNVFIDSGAQVRLGHNPPVVRHETSGQVTYTFASDLGEIDSLFNSVNTSLQRKGMNPITRDEFDARVKHSVIPQPVVNFLLQLNFHKYFRSLVKTSMAMAFSLGIKPLDCENAVPYLRDETMEEEGVVALIDTSLEGLVDDWANHHAVTIFGLPDGQELIGEVVYFGRVAGLVTLSNSYRGPRIIAGHAINLMTGDYVNADLNLPDLVLPEDVGLEMLRERIGRFKSPMLLQLLGDMNRIVDEAQGPGR